MTKSWAISAVPNSEPPLAFLMRDSCCAWDTEGTELLLLAPASVKSLRLRRAFGLTPCVLTIVRTITSSLSAASTWCSGATLAVVVGLVPQSVSWTRLPLSLDMWNWVSVSVALVLLTCSTVQWITYITMQYSTVQVPSPRWSR